MLANLREARLGGANLHKVNLFGTILDDSELWRIPQGKIL